MSEKKFCVWHYRGVRGGFHEWYTRCLGDHIDEEHITDQWKYCPVCGRLILEEKEGANEQADG